MKTGRFGRAFVVALSGVAWTAAPGVADEGAALVGRVVAHDEPVANARVRVLGSSSEARTGADGRFELHSLAAGRALVEAVDLRHGRGLAEVVLVAGESVEVEIEVNREVHSDEVTVTASAVPRLGDELARPVSVMDEDELLVASATTLGETLGGETGVSSTYFGPGASRPIIRGLGGDRIRVLDDGLGTGDVSSTSPDHATATEPLLAERVEVVRGPATLLWGSSAVGGVVNVIDEAIRESLPEGGVTGTLVGRFGSAAEEKAAAVEAAGRIGRFAWHVDAARRRSEDVDIPGFAESRELRAAEALEHDDEHEGEDEEQAFGTLPNSAVETDAGRLGLSWVGERGFFGIAVSGYDTLYGVPGHAHEEGHGHGDDEDEHGEDEHDEEAHGEEEHDDEHGEEGEEEAVRIDLDRRRIDLKGRRSFSGSFVESLSMRAGLVDYEHRELEGEEVGTLFLSDSREARVEVRHRPVAGFQGAWGVQVSTREFEAIGEEAFVPSNDARTTAVFVLEELERGPLLWQLGARWEETAYDVAAGADLPDRTFSGLSGSVGLVYRAREGVAASVALSRSVVAPNAEALYSDGAHVATRVFEVGEPGLDRETSLGLELGLRVERGRVRGELDVYRNRFDDFVFEAPTGEEEDGLPVVAFRQEDAEFTGFEASGHIELVHRDDGHLELDLSVEAVRAELTGSGEPLPRIPPLRFGAGLAWRSDHWSASLGVRRIERQDRVATFETETAGHTLVDASLGRRFFVGGSVHDLLLSAANLTDEEARVHASFLKDLAPLPGRDVRLTYRLRF